MWLKRFEGTWWNVYIKYAVNPDWSLKSVYIFSDVVLRLDKVPCSASYNMSREVQRNSV